MKLSFFLLLFFAFIFYVTSFNIQEVGQALAKMTKKIESELGFKLEPKQNESFSDELTKCPKLCTNQISELQKNFSEMAMAIFALSSQLERLHKHVLHHDQVLKHAVEMAHGEVNQQHHHHHQHKHQDINFGKLGPNQNIENFGAPTFQEESVNQNVTVNSNANSNVDDENVKFKTCSGCIFVKTRFGIEDVEIPQELPESEIHSKNIVNHSNKNSHFEHHQRDGNSVHQVVIHKKSNKPVDQQTSASDQLQRRMDLLEREFRNWFGKVVEAYLESRVNKSVNVTSGNMNDEKLQGMEDNLNEEYVYATCEVHPNRHIALLNQQDVFGRINMWQRKTNGPLQMHVKLKGFKLLLDQTERASLIRETRETIINPIEASSETDNQKSPLGNLHAMHVHEYGNLTRDCQSTGSHYNPHGMVHGGPLDPIRHVGDLGNIRSDDNGETDVELIFGPNVSLLGPHSIIDRSIVIHALSDDYGRNPDIPASMTTGNSGVRIACCSIKQVNQLPVEADSRTVVGAVAATRHRMTRSNRRGQKRRLCSFNC